MAKKALSRKTLPGLVKGLAAANKPKQCEPLFKNSLDTREDVREARIELLRAIARENPFDTTIVTSGQAHLCTQLLTEIEHSLPDEKRRSHGDEHDWAKNIHNETLDKVIAAIDKLRTEPGDLPAKVAKEVSGALLELSATVESMRKRVKE